MEHNLLIDRQIWKQVKIFQINRDMKNVNEAAVALIKIGLKHKEEVLDNGVAVPQEKGV